MAHDLEPKTSQLFVANLINSPTIDCDSRLDLKNFRLNLAVPELIKRLHDWNTGKTPETIRDKPKTERGLAILASNAG